MTYARLQGWIPIRVYRDTSQWMVDWCYVGQRRFTEPFFEQTVNACLRQPFNQLFRQQTPIETLVELHAQQPGLRPNGFIFHMSRCGSTLIAQLLATLPHTIVLAEAGPIDTILRAPAHDPTITDEQRRRWLQGVINALGQPLRGNETALVIKFDSWSILDLPLIHGAFPDVPWVFVFRDPVEVLVSHQRERGSQMVPSIIDPQVFGLDQAALHYISLDEYAAQVLARMCSAALEYHNIGNGRLIHYPQLPEIVWSSLLDFFNIPYVHADFDAIQRAARFHAKRPTEAFQGDITTKQHAAPERLRHIAQQLVEPVYHQLLALLPTRGLRC